MPRFPRLSQASAPRSPRLPKPRALHARRAQRVGSDSVGGEPTQIVILWAWVIPRPLSGSTQRTLVGAMLCCKPVERRQTRCKTWFGRDGSRSAGASAPSWSRRWRACRGGAPSWAWPWRSRVFFMVAGGLSASRGPRGPGSRRGLGGAVAVRGDGSLRARGHVRPVGRRRRQAVAHGGRRRAGAGRRARPLPATWCTPTAWPRTCSARGGAAATSPP